ncbi:hypothetical protein ACODHD_10385 [Vagococcus fluvialis]|uniref:hypothetical protein n=1 Tax=Vagococcus fluvialis TaxID=2738 RepID=UPI003B5ACFB9
MFFIVIILIILVLTSTSDKRGRMNNQEAGSLIVWIVIGLGIGIFLVTKGLPGFAMFAAVVVMALGFIKSLK